MVIRFNKPIGLAALLIVLVTAMWLVMDQGPKPVSNGNDSPQAAAPAAATVSTDDAAASVGATKHDMLLVDTQPTSTPSAATGASAIDPMPSAQTTNPVDRPPLHLSPIAQLWLERDGITAEDIRTTVEKLRREGVPEHVLQDPDMVRQRLPRRNVHAVRVGELTLPETAAAGQPVPFSLSGALPDPSYSFTHFDVVREDDRIVIRPLGQTSGDPAPGIEVPVLLEGSLPPLPPGQYRVEYPGMAPDQPRLITIQ